MRLIAITLSHVSSVLEERLHLVPSRVVDQDVDRTQHVLRPCDCGAHTLWGGHVSPDRHGALAALRRHLASRGLIEIRHRHAGTGAASFSAIARPMPRPARGHERHFCPTAAYGNLPAELCAKNGKPRSPADRGSGYCFRTTVACSLNYGEPDGLFNMPRGGCQAHGSASSSGTRRRRQPTGGLRRHDASPQLLGPGDRASPPAHWG